MAEPRDRRVDIDNEDDMLDVNDGELILSEHSCTVSFVRVVGLLTIIWMFTHNDRVALYLNMTPFCWHAASFCWEDSIPPMLDTLLELICFLHIPSISMFAFLIIELCSCSARVYRCIGHERLLNMISIHKLMYFPLVYLIFISGFDAIGQMVAVQANDYYLLSMMETDYTNELYKYRSPMSIYLRTLTYFFAIVLASLNYVVFTKIAYMVDSVVERGSLGSRNSLPTCSTATRVRGAGLSSWPPAVLTAPLSQLWFGRQIHATRLFVWSQLILSAIAVFLLITVATGGLARVQFDWCLGAGSMSTDDKPVEALTSDEATAITPLPTFDTPTPSTSTVAVAVGESRQRADGSVDYGRQLASIAIGLAYFYLISIPLAWWGVQAAEARGRREEAMDGECRRMVCSDEEKGGGGGANEGLSAMRRRKCGTPSCMRRAMATMLLAPWLLSVFSLTIPLLLTTLRLLTDRCFYCPGSSTVSEDDHRQHDQQMSTLQWILNEAWFKYVPLLIVWVLMFYFLYGCSLAFVFVWRRADGRYGGAGYGTLAGLECGGGGGGLGGRGLLGSRLRESAAAASFSWTFRSTKDRYRITNKDGELNKSTYSMASNRSWKSTRNPTLRGYTKKTDDLDVSLLSEEQTFAGGDVLEKAGNYNNNEVLSSSPSSGPFVCTFTTLVGGGGAANIRSNRRLTPADQMRASRGFAGYAGAGISRAPLEPVEEEEFTPTPEKTAEDLRM